MNTKLGIVIGGIIAAAIAVGVVSSIYNLTETIFAGRIIAIAASLITSGILYTITYTLSDARNGELEGVAAGVFAGAVGGILTWAIGDAIFGPFALTGLIITALIGGFIMSMQIDARTL